MDIDENSAAWMLQLGITEAELKAHRESMAWARDKLRVLKKNLEYCASACKDIEMALDEENNPLLKKGVST